MLLRNILACTVTLFSICAPAQSVISANSGLVSSAEGEVLIDGRITSRINGRFPELSKGSLLSTSEGKAEILLGPGSFLWLGRHSGLRMQDSSLAAARVELLEGSAVVQSPDVSPDNSVTLIHQGSQVRMPAHGLYRLDASPSQLTVLDGEANVINGERKVIVNEGSRLAFSSGLIAPVTGSEPDDLDRWALERRLAIAADNRDRLRREAKAHQTPTRHRRRFPFPATVTPFPGRVR